MNVIIVEVLILCNMGKIVSYYTDEKKVSVVLTNNSQKELYTGEDIELIYRKEIIFSMNKVLYIIRLLVMAVLLSMPVYSCVDQRSGTGEKSLTDNNNEEEEELFPDTIYGYIGPSRFKYPVTGDEWLGLVVKNNTKRNYTFGGVAHEKGVDGHSYFDGGIRFEYLTEDGKWEPIRKRNPDDNKFSFEYQVANGLSAGDSVVLVYQPFAPDIFYFEPGRYRIGKKFRYLNENWDGVDDRDRDITVIIYGELEIIK